MHVRAMVSMLLCWSMILGLRDCPAHCTCKYRRRSRGVFDKSGSSIGVGDGGEVVVHGRVITDSTITRCSILFFGAGTMADEPAAFLTDRPEVHGDGQPPADRTEAPGPGGAPTSFGDY